MKYVYSEDVPQPQYYSVIRYHSDQYTNLQTSEMMETSQTIVHGMRTSNAGVKAKII